jgi:hypothetical protein
MSLSCRFERRGAFMVCEHGLLQIPIVDDSLPPELYAGSCQPRTEAGEFSGGLGDWVERQLGRIGLTRSRYLAIKQRLGLAPVCRCDGRKALLNRFGGWLLGIFARQKPPAAGDD